MRLRPSQGGKHEIVQGQSSWTQRPAHSSDLACPSDPYLATSAGAGEKLTSQTPSRLSRRSHLSRAVSAANLEWRRSNRGRKNHCSRRKSKAANSAWRGDDRLHWPHHRRRPLEQPCPLHRAQMGKRRVPPTSATNQTAPGNVDTLRIHVRRGHRLGSTKHSRHSSKNPIWPDS